MPKRIVFPERGRTALQSFELPSPGPAEVVTRSLYSLMSIGTETIILNQRYAPDSHFARMFSFPQLKTGVQTVAQVAEAGPEVTDFQVGDYVYQRHAHCSHHVVAQAACSPIPDGTDLKSAAWCGLAKTAFRAAWAGKFGPGGSVLIIGAGPVGQMCLRWAAALKMSRMAVCDLSEYRLDHARHGGAQHCLHGDVDSLRADIEALWGNVGPPLVVDSTGNPAAFSAALRTTAPFGKVILLGDAGFPERQCLTSDVMVKGLTVTATHDNHDRDGWTQRKIDARFFDLLQRGAFRVDRLISHELSPTDHAQAYGLANEQRGHTMGVLFDWTGQSW